MTEYAQVNGWSGMTPSAFKRQIRRAKKEAARGCGDTLQLCVNSEFVHRYLDLSRRDRNKVRGAIRGAPFAYLRLSVWGRLSLTQHGEAIDDLFETIGSIRTLDTVYCDSSDFAEFYGGALRFLRLMKNLSISIAPCGALSPPPGHVRTIVAGLVEHFYLEHVSAEVHFILHGELCQSFADIPCVAEIRLDYFLGGLGRDRCDAAEVGTVLQMNKPSSIVALSHLHCSLASWPAFARGVRHASVKGLSLHSCRFFCGGTLLGHAFMGSNLQEISISYLPDERISYWSSFLPAFAQSIPTMFKLQRLMLDGDCRTVDNQMICELALLQVLSAVSRCPQFMSLELYIFSYSTTFDKGVADCVRNCKLLESLTLRYHIVSWDLKRRLMAPALYEAIKANFRIKTVLRFDLRPRLNFWDEATKLEIDTLLRLNRNGRCYILSDPLDVYAGLGVLGHVSDSLDCLYFHLRENLMLCARKDPSTEGRQWRHTIYFICCCFRRAKDLMYDSLKICQFSFALGRNF